MQINGWKVIYNGIIYRPINIMPDLNSELEIGSKMEPRSIEMIVVDDRGRLVFIRDWSREFQFVKDLGNE